MSSHGKKTRSPGYKIGDYWVECQRCGKAVRQHNIRKEWSGDIVCRECWEIRHPQDFVRGIRDTITPQGIYRPESTDEFADATCRSRTGVVGLAIVGCAIVGNDGDKYIRCTSRTSVASLGKASCAIANRREMADKSTSIPYSPFDPYF